MSTNPYQSPQAESASLETQPPLRREALKSVRVATILLTLAGVFNFYCFCVHGRTLYIGTPTPSMVDLTEFAAGCVGIGLIAVVCWFAFLPVLEFLSRMIHSIGARNTDPKQWDEALYASLQPAALLAIPGMILWIIWVIGFYFLGANFFVISYAVGIPSHILAACLYVPLLFRWYKLWRSPMPSADSDAG